MLAQSVKVLLLVAAAAALSACSTPCDAPGRLCAPISSITSPAPAPLPPAPPPPPPKPAPPPEPPPETFAVQLPQSGALASASEQSAGASRAGLAGLPSLTMQSVTPDQSAHPNPSGQPALTLQSLSTVHIALLLPLRSEALGPAAESLRAGFMAAWQRDQDGIAVDVVDTGDAVPDVLASYAVTQDKHDIIVGPLARNAVTALAASGLVRKPTIALNLPDNHDTASAAPLPPNLLAMGLSIEEEARQAAQWAAAEHPNGSALVVLSGTQWQQRIAAAFSAQWQRLGMSVRTVAIDAPNGALNAADLLQLRISLQAELPDVIFAALGADQTRQLRTALGGDLPIYGTSALNPGAGTPDQVLDGVHLLDLPWQLQNDHPAVMAYPHPPAAAERAPGAADMERLYALGIDAFRVARQIARQPSGSFHIDGVTGQLAVSFGQGAASFERTEQQAIYKNGVAQAVAAQ